MKGLFAIACVALVALVCVAPVSACNDYGAANVGAFNIVQAQPFVQQVYAPQPFVQQQVIGGYGQAFVQRQRVVVRQPVVVRQQVVVRQPLVRVRAPFVAIGY